MKSAILTLALLFCTGALAQADAPDRPTGSVQAANESHAGPDEYAQFIKRVQIALHLHGFDPGPVNGRDEGRTQAALAQFQLSRNIPASGSLDDATLKELGVARNVPEAEENASAGAGMPIARP